MALTPPELVKEHLLVAESRFLSRDEIRPADEIRELRNMHKVSLDSKGLSLGKLLENLSTEHLDLIKYSDAYSKELEKLIDSKAKGKPITEKPVEKVQET